MGSDRSELLALLAARNRQAFSADIGSVPEPLDAALEEKLPDLTSSVRRNSLAESLRDAPAGDVRWAELAYREREAVALGSAEARREREVRGRSATIRELGGVAFADAEWELASLERPPARAEARGSLERAGAELAAGEHELARTMNEAARGGGIVDPFAAWSLAREREPARLGALAAELLDRTDAGFGLAVRGWQRLIPAVETSWVDLPWFLRGEPAASMLPSPGVDLAEYLAGSLGLRSVLEQRLRLEPFSGAGRPGPHLLMESPGNQAVAAWRPQGGIRDYRAVLRALGESLGVVLREPADETTARLADPALALLIGAIFESTLREPAWFELTLRKPVAATVVQHLRLCLWLRVRQLAAGVLADALLPWAAALPSGPDWSRATGFDHADGLVPWSCSTERAADELAAWLAAPLVWDWLATRYGRLWIGRPEAGRLLRDLWSAGHTTLEALLRDLGLGALAVEPLLDLWSPVDG